ncbi:hypothetical protein ACP70R_044145 [Stipagrostis hirtigluma subsp. patula]
MNITLFVSVMQNFKHATLVYDKMLLCVLIDLAILVLSGNVDDIELDIYTLHTLMLVGAEDSPAQCILNGFPELLF